MWHQPRATSSPPHTHTHAHVPSSPPPPLPYVPTPSPRPAAPARARAACARGRKPSPPPPRGADRGPSPSFPQKRVQSILPFRTPFPSKTRSGRVTKPQTLKTSNTRRSEPEGALGGAPGRSRAALILSARARSARVRAPSNRMGSAFGPARSRRGGGSGRGCVCASARGGAASHTLPAGVQAGAARRRRAGRPRARTRGEGSNSGPAEMNARSVEHERGAPAGWSGLHGARLVWRGWHHGGIMRGLGAGGTWMEPSLHPRRTLARRRPPGVRGVVWR